MKAIHDFGIQTGDAVIWNAGEKTQGEMRPGDLANLCFGEIGWGGMPKRRGSYQWVAVLERDGDQFHGVTLEDGWMAGPRAHTLVWFSQDQVCKVGDPDSVVKEVKETRAWREEELEKSYSAPPCTMDDSWGVPF